MGLDHIWIREGGVLGCINAHVSYRPKDLAGSLLNMGTSKTGRDTREERQGGGGGFRVGVGAEKILIINNMWPRF